MEVIPAVGRAVRSARVHAGSSYGRTLCNLAQQHYSVDVDVDCGTAGKWFAAGGGTIGWDTSNYYAGSTQSVTVTGGPTPILQYRTPAAPLNLAGKYLLVRLQRNDAVPDATYGSYTVKFYSESNYSKVSSVFTLWGVGRHYNACDSCQGWFEFCMPMADVGLGTLTDFTAITMITVQSNLAAGGEADFGLHRLQVLSAVGSYYCIRIDWVSPLRVDAVAAYAKAAGVRLTIGAWMASLDGGSGLSTWDVRRLIDSGHEIVVYGNAPVSRTWDDWTPAQKLEYIPARLKDMCRQVGMDWNGVFFVPGGNGVSVWDRVNLVGPGILSCISGTSTTVVGLYMLQVPGFRQLDWTGFINGGADGLIPSWLPGKITECESNGGCVVLGAHISDDDHVASLEAAIDALAASALACRTFGDFVSQ